jgi:hypothetical protein
VEGGEGWPLQYFDQDFGMFFPVRFREWNEFIGRMSALGLDAGYDICDVSGGVGKNIIAGNRDSLEPNVQEHELSRNWKRIDFGTISLPLKLERMKTYANETDDVLMRCCVDYLNGSIGYNIDERVLEFRAEILENL